MPRKKVIPSYRLHKARNCAVVTIDGKNFYLGPYDSPESYEKYARHIAEWKVKKSKPEAAPANGQPPAVKQVRDLLLAWMRHAETRYVKNDKPTSEVSSFQTALRPVRKLYGTQPITSFGPLALVACRQVLIDAGYCRKRINQHVGRIRQVFKWGVSMELVLSGTAPNRVRTSLHQSVRQVACRKVGSPLKDRNCRVTVTRHPVSEGEADQRKRTAWDRQL